MNQAGIAAVVDFSPGSTNDYIGVAIIINVTCGNSKTEFFVRCDAVKYFVGVLVNELVTCAVEACV